MLTINDFKPRDPEEGHPPEEGQFRNHWLMCVCYEVLWSIHEKLDPDYISRIEYSNTSNELGGSLSIEWYRNVSDGSNTLVSRLYPYSVVGARQDTLISTIHKSLQYFGQLSCEECWLKYRDYSIPADMRKSISAYRLVFDYKTWSAQEIAYVCTPEKMCRNI